MMRKHARGQSSPLCAMALPAARRAGWAGPRIRMTLPSFSGATAECPDLLHYACQLCTNVRVVRPAHLQVGPWLHCTVPKLHTVMYGAKTGKEEKVHPGVRGRGRGLA